MKQGRHSQGWWVVIGLVALLGLVAAALAIADTFSADNDTVAPGNQAERTLTAAPGETVNTTQQLVLDYQGSKHAAAGSTVTASVNPAQTNLPSGYSVSTVVFNVPADWGSTTTQLTGTSAISFAAPATPGTYTYTVKWDASASACSGGANCVTGGNAMTINLTVTASPSVTTSVRDGAGDDFTGGSRPFGTSVHDSATLGDLVAGTDATGEVTYSFFNGGECADDPADQETVTVGADSSVPDSSERTPAPGEYSYSAHYSGDDNYEPADGECEPFTIEPAAEGCSGTLGGVDLGGLTNYLFFAADGGVDANWQGATKGFAGDVAVDGELARERTSGGVPFAGTLFTNDSSADAWQKIVDQKVNLGQAFSSTNETARISGLKADLNNAFTQINALPVTPGFASRSAQSLNGVNTQNGIKETIVVNVTSGFQVSSKINITGDAGDVFILRWDTDANFANGYQGQVKFQSGGAIVPLGGLSAGSFIHAAGDLNASGGGSNPAPPYPQGPRLNDGMGALINGGSNWNGGGFFTGYWLTTGTPGKGDTAPFSNAIFVGGWYSKTNKFSMTSGTSGVHVCPNRG